MREQPFPLKKLHTCIEPPSKPPHSLVWVMILTHGHPLADLQRLIVHQHTLGFSQALLVDNRCDGSLDAMRALDPFVRLRMITVFRKFECYARMSSHNMIHFALRNTSIPALAFWLSLPSNRKGLGSGSRDIRKVSTALLISSSTFVNSIFSKPALTE